MMMMASALLSETNVTMAEELNEFLNQTKTIGGQ